MRIALRYLIPGGIFALALSLLLVFAVAEVATANRRAETNLRAHARIVGNIVAAAVETAARRGNIDESSIVFEQTRGDRRLIEAVIVDQRDVILYGSALMTRSQPLAATRFATAQALLEHARRSDTGQTEVAADGSSILSVFPIRLAPDRDEYVASRVGALLMRHSLAAEKAAALAAAVARVAVLAAVLAVLCVLVWVFFDRNLVRSLRALVHAAGELALGRRVTTAPGNTGVLEIAQLASAFDDMATTLQRRTSALEGSRAFLFATMDALPSHVAVLDHEGAIVAVNQAWRDFGAAHGLTAAAHGVGMNYIAVCESDDGPDADASHTVARGLRGLLTGGRAKFSIEYRCGHDGVDEWFNAEMRLFENQGSVQILVAHQNITSIKSAEQALRIGEERYRFLYDQNPSMFLTVAADGRIASINDFGAEQLGYSSAQLIGRSVFGLYEEASREVIQEHLGACIASPGTVVRWETVKLRQDGSRIWVRETGRFAGAPEDANAILVVCEDMTEAQELSERLKHQASHDSLTGLINRREFERRLELAVQSAVNDGAEHVLCYVDLDQFKVVNDTCGHIAGDELLRQIAGVINGQVRAGDTLARLGGDEFGILMEHCPTEQGVARAESIRAAVEDYRFVWENSIFALGASIGVAPLGYDSRSAIGALGAADAACYAAKDAGRNRVHVHRPHDLESSRRHGEMRWVSRLNRTLDEDLFELYFQRIEPADPGAGDQGLHYELLIRMHDEDGQAIAPGAFLPAAERFQLASRIDRWVVSAATEWLAARPAHVEALKLCAINISGQSVADDSFLEHVEQCIEFTGVPAAKLCFEITETAAIADLTRATRFMRRLSERGCRFALDDFGSGLSSFAYLKHLPADILKIDGVFVRDIATDPIDAAMVRSINDIGQLMGKQTVAEFVENEAIIARLREIGVDFIQGYAVDRPSPLREFDAP